MTKKNFFSRYLVRLSLGLILLSLILHALHLLLFRDAHHLAIYLLGDIAFVPLEVLLVSVILHRLLEHRAKRERIKKLNMVIGAFFTETGHVLLGLMAMQDDNREQLARALHISTQWTAREYTAALTTVRHSGEGPVFNQENMEGLRTLLVAQRPFLLTLLQNPTLLEHHAFSDLIWAILHLTEELVYRPDLPASLRVEQDRNHLRIDIKRVYTTLLTEWLAYTRHLQEDYPHLFSLAIRINPLTGNGDATVVP